MACVKEDPCVCKRLTVLLSGQEIKFLRWLADMDGRKLTVGDMLDQCMLEGMESLKQSYWEQFQDAEEKQPQAGHKGRRHSLAGNKK